MARRGEIIGAVDFGSSAIRVVIARKGDDGAIQILGHGTSPSKGCVSSGLIQDLNVAQQALKKALAAAEKEAGARVISLFCGVNGQNVSSHLREGQVKIDTEVVDHHQLTEALEQASNDLMSTDKRSVSSVTSQEWYVDSLRVTNPIGIRGRILKLRVHFLQLPCVIQDNLIMCVEAQGRELEDIVYMPLAAAHGCLTPEDMELGVAVVDIGRNTMGISVYRDHRIMYAETFELGGFFLTRDVAAGLQVGFEEAAELVQEYGIAKKLLDKVKRGDTADTSNLLEKSGSGTHIKLKSPVPGAPSIVDRDDLDFIIYERSRELLLKVKRELDKKGVLKHLVRGVVLTGGGAEIANQARLAEIVFGIQARIGQPYDIDVMPPPVNTPTYVPITGVIRHGFAYRDAIRSGRIAVARNPISRLFGGFGSFFSKYFF